MATSEAREEAKRSKFVYMTMYACLLVFSVGFWFKYSDSVKSTMRTLYTVEVQTPLNQGSDAFRESVYYCGEFSEKPTGGSKEALEKILQKIELSENSTAMISEGCSTNSTTLIFE